MRDEFYMNLAIQKAWEFQLLTYPNPAVGCLILDKFGKILSIKAHEKAGEPHAELNAIKDALIILNPSFESKFNTLKNPNELYEYILKNHSNLLLGAVAFVTLEPCNHYGKTPPCAYLLKELKFSKVVIATSELNSHAKGGENLLKQAGIKTKLGVLKDEADELIEPFIAWNKDNFSFFKLAISANGVVTGGIISNQKGRTHVHKIRSLIELLVIGGNTVRTDKPTLDTRLIKDGKNPNILIYSKSNDFDRSIPLFNVFDRKIEISNSLESAFKHKFVMIEGGENFLSNLDKKIKWLLIYRSNKFKKDKNININLNFKIMCETKLNDNTLSWCKIIS